MISEYDNNIRDILGVANDTVEERRKDYASDLITSTISPSVEFSIFRKTIKYMLGIMKELHGGELDIQKFEEYDKLITSLIDIANKKYNLEE